MIRDWYRRRRAESKTRTWNTAGKLSEDRRKSRHRKSRSRRKEMQTRSDLEIEIREKGCFNRTSNLLSLGGKSPTLKKACVG